MENWRDVPGYEGLYQVSSHGRVASLARKVKLYRCGRQEYRSCGEQILRPIPDKNGYPRAVLQREGVAITHKIHRLVMAAFRGDSNLHVNHMDLNKKNNHLSNLEYVTRKQNAAHARDNGAYNPPKGANCYNYKITPDIAKQIVLLRGKKTTDEIGHMFNIHPMTCYKIWNRYG